jgi:hypothetical protein
MDLPRYLENPPPVEAPRFWTSPEGLRVAWTQHGDPDEGFSLAIHRAPTAMGLLASHR